jgi:glyoxylase-like metal-dependent hydrolase (beta-lactamase superfamily II)
MHPGEHGEVKDAKPLETDKEIVPGVRIVHTPGHTMGSVSVFVKADQRYAIAGDAVPKYGNFEKMVPPRINVDEKLALESIKMIIRYADVIIPGHDPPFITNR